MFKNIGGKIKTVTYVSVVLGMLLCVLLGMGLLATSPVLGFFVVLFGTLLIWLVSLVSYGFGQLVENSDEILKELRKQNTPAVAPKAIPAVGMEATESENEQG